MAKKDKKDKKEKVNSYVMNQDKKELCRDEECKSPNVHLEQVEEGYSATCQKCGNRYLLTIPTS